MLERECAAARFGVQQVLSVLTLGGAKVRVGAIDVAVFPKTKSKGGRVSTGSGQYGIGDGAATGSFARGGAPVIFA